MLLDRMVARQSICLHRLAAGSRAREVGFGRFLANAKVTPARLIESWSERTSAAVKGRHVLAIQDTSEITFATHPTRRRGLGKIGKGGGCGVLVHAMVALDAKDGACLGLVAGDVYTRDKGKVTVPHGERLLADKESRRWVETAQAAKLVLAGAAQVTIVADRESDIYTQWALVPEAGIHVLTRLRHDRSVAGGGTLSEIAEALPFVATRTVALRATPEPAAPKRATPDRAAPKLTAPERAARDAVLSLRFSEVEIMRPKRPDARGLADKVALRMVDVIERDPPAGVAPVHWRLLTTHAVDDAAAAWRIVDWYRRRWTIEQLFRLMKTHGLRLEDSQLADAAGLIKLAIIATKAAAVILQLVQARDGDGAASSPASAGLAFTEPEQAVLERLDVQVQGKTALQKNPHPKQSLAWAAWIIAKLGGWDGYPSSKPPGPITFRHGLAYFHSLVEGWTLRDMCMP